MPFHIVVCHYRCLRHCDSASNNKLAEVLRRKREVLGELRIFCDQFDVIFDSAIREAKRLDVDDLQLPRKRRVPARIDIVSEEQFQFTDVKSL